MLFFSIWAKLGKSEVVVDFGEVTCGMVEVIIY